MHIIAESKVPFPMEELPSSPGKPGSSSPSWEEGKLDPGTLQEDRKAAPLGPSLPSPQAAPCVPLPPSQPLQLPFLLSERLLPGPASREKDALEQRSF